MIFFKKLYSYVVQIDWARINYVMSGEKDTFIVRAIWYVR